MTDLAFELDDAAEAEFYTIVDYYNNTTLPYLHETKRIILRRFPYSIVYKIYGDEVIVAHAVMHMSRKPDYWKERLK